MVTLSPTEARVFGVLIEKSLTTPEQYPLSINAATNGSNQKSNRDPVLALAEDDCFEALEGLRTKGLAVRVDVPGNRVHKYRHSGGETLHVRTTELAVLAELLLRGPQTLGELRGRASRMSPLESLDATEGMLTALMTREVPLVKELPPSPGSRAIRYMQLLAPEAPTTEPAAQEALDAPGGSSAPAAAADPSLIDRIAKLESRVENLSKAVRKLAAALGEADPIEHNG